MSNPTNQPPPHWPFAAKHDNCAECEREYKPVLLCEECGRTWQWQAEPLTRFPRILKSGYRT